MPHDAPSYGLSTAAQPHLQEKSTESTATEQPVCPAVLTPEPVETQQNAKTPSEGVRWASGWFWLSALGSRLKTLDYSAWYSGPAMRIGLMSRRMLRTV